MISLIKHGVFLGRDGRVLDGNGLLSGEGILNRAGFSGRKGIPEGNGLPGGEGIPDGNGSARADMVLNGNIFSEKDMASMALGGNGFSEEKAEEKGIPQMDGYTEAAIREGRKRTMAYRILAKHNRAASGNGSRDSDMDRLRIRFDAMVSPDNNYVNILQTARASGMKSFPMPYVLSNCHNTLCAVGGTILEDDHVFGLSNVKKYGGIFVPPYRAVLHQYMRERMAGGGKMILGSDSHTRYGALGTMGIGEGGGELVKQLVGQTWDIPYPEIIAVRLCGMPRPGVGPMDVALLLVSKCFANGFVKNKVLEFVGPGIRSLSMEYRMGIDVMTTESAALSSIWCTDEKTREYLAMHGREGDYRELSPEDGAYYDGMIDIDLSDVEPMIALPFHPSNALPIREFLLNLDDMLSEVEKEGRRIKGDKGKAFSIMRHIRNGGFYPDQALVSGCAGGMFENIAAIADILRGHGIRGDGLNLHVNPSSLPVMDALMRSGIASELAQCGVTMRPAICGPCFGVTDTPANNQLSIRHVTRNYTNREGSKPGQGQMAAVFLMDARSIAATVRNDGRLTSATELPEETWREHAYLYSPGIYESQVFDYFGKGDSEVELVMGPNIADWPEMPVLKKHLLLKVAGSYKGSVTTDELLPSGESSSYRSNPEKISEFTMQSRDPGYVGRAKEIRSEAREIGILLSEKERAAREGVSQSAGFKAAKNTASEGTRFKASELLSALSGELHCDVSEISYGSLMVSEQIGDGSSREQAASCQKVLGGWANLANEYSTKRYRSNCINWGLLPLRTEDDPCLPVGTFLLIRNIREMLKSGKEELEAEVVAFPESEFREADGIGRRAAATAGAFPESEIGRASDKAFSGYVPLHITRKIQCTLGSLTEEEREILCAGCLINYYRR